MKKLTITLLSITLFFMVFVPVIQANNTSSAPVIESMYDNATIYDGTYTFSEGLAWVVLDYKAGVASRILCK